MWHGEVSHVTSVHEWIERVWALMVRDLTFDAHGMLVEWGE